MLAHAGTNPFEPRAPLVGRQRDRPSERVGLVVDVERLHAERPRAELREGPCLSREDEHAVPIVHERRLLRDEVQPVHHRIDEEHVVLRVRSDRGGEVVVGPRAGRAASPVARSARSPPQRRAPSRRDSPRTRESPASTGRGGQGARRDRGARGRARAVARTPRTRGRRSSTDPCGRPGRRGSRGGPPGSRSCARRTASLVASESNSAVSTAIGFACDTCSASSPRPRRVSQEATKAERHCSVWNPTLSHARRLSWTAPRDLGRQDGPGVGPDPRDVDEEGDPSIRAHLADERGDEVEVVVVDVERRAGSPIELCDRGLRDRAVGGHVAVAPRHGQVGVRVALEAPQTVLHEPEDGVRDDAVEQAIRLRIVRDEPEPERRPGGGALVAGSGGAELLLDISHRARDPGDVAAIDEGAERGDEAACAAHGASARRPRRGESRPGRGSRRRRAARSTGRVPVQVMLPRSSRARSKPG